METRSANERRNAAIMAMLEWSPVSERHAFVVTVQNKPWRAKIKKVAGCSLRSTKGILFVFMHLQNPIIAIIAERLRILYTRSERLLIKLSYPMKKTMAIHTKKAVHTKYGSVSLL